MEKKPEWLHKIEFELAKWIYCNSITKITHHWEFTSEDTSRHWIELHSKGDKTSKEETRVVPSISDHGEVNFNPDHRTLIQLNRQLQDDIRKILQWETSNKIKINQFHKLKEELGL